MGNSYPWPMIRLVQSVCMILTLSCCAYVIFFLFFKAKEDLLSDNSNAVSATNIALVSPSSLFDIKPYNASVNIQDRDIFSMTPTEATSSVENTPKGQLPDHLKIVGILIAHPSQIIIEDSIANNTYFIDEGTPQDGIKIVKVDKDQMIINYQGQNISVPIQKN